MKLILIKTLRFCKTVYTIPSCSITPDRLEANIEGCYLKHYLFYIQPEVARNK